MFSHLPPVYKVNFLFLFSDASYKILVDFAQRIMDSTTEDSALHDVCWDSFRNSNGEDNSASHREEIDFPFSQFTFKSINNEIKVMIYWTRLFEGESQVFTQVRGRVKAYDLAEGIVGLLANIGRDKFLTWLN